MSWDRTCDRYQWAYSARGGSIYIWNDKECRCVEPIDDGTRLRVSFRLYIALKLDPKLYMEVMGSYRRYVEKFPSRNPSPTSCADYVCRGKADCGDIDILVTRPTDDGKTHSGKIFCFSCLIGWLSPEYSGIMRRLLQSLHQQGILSHDLSLPEDLDDLETSYRGLCQMRNGGKQRRIGWFTA
jgi:DNA polymerase lambda